MALLDEDIAFHSKIPVPVDIMVAVVYSIFGVCSLFGNSTLLYISYKKKHLLKPAEYFIINLAVSDLGLTLSLYPMAITSSFLPQVAVWENSVLHIRVLRHVVWHLQSDHSNPAKHGVLCESMLSALCSWVYALLFACSPLVHWGEYGPEPYGTACCIDWRQSNQHVTARSYTVALFTFCYILPCCVIVASYTGILVKVHASRRNMEQHATRRTHMSSIQKVIVKLSVAVCIGFLAAWSPYAVVSMWAAFGHIDNIPPLAFAMPAMFAKSSTIYNPIIYLMLRPSFRSVMCSDLGHACVKGCLCLLRLKEHSCVRCADAFECFGHYPQMCTNPVANVDSSKDQDSTVPQTHRQKTQRACHKKSLLSTMCATKTSEMDNFHINLEMIPGHAKVAWP
ncbi:G-protein coupled receptor 136 [Collichthys lucidus]|uniref:G-protein coupled receptor 136 n=1 Tax=Collichthys lucidus TaxID=240159 RepID=A0A4U5UXV2_COLLU|nr:G-protein coupled receptor 136 [Collichthys lucidus]